MLRGVGNGPPRSLQPSTIRCRCYPLARYGPSPGALFYARLPSQAPTLLSLPRRVNPLPLTCTPARSLLPSSRSTTSGRLPPSCCGLLREYSSISRSLPACPGNSNRRAMGLGHPLDDTWALPLREPHPRFTGFLPLWCGLTKREQASALVSRNYLSDDRFRGAFGVRSLSNQETMYSLAFSSNPSNWFGSV